MACPCRDVCIVGVGPRGLSVLERLCATARDLSSPEPRTVHVIDPYPPGSGQVWRTDQSRQLLMNTVACQVTVFTDASVEMAGPLDPGPSLYEWARALASSADGESGPRAAGRQISGAASEGLPGSAPHVEPGRRPAAAQPAGAPTAASPAPATAASPTDAPAGPPAGALADLPTDLDAATLAEAAALGPDTYPSRALYGSYLGWAFARIVAGAPAHLAVRVHRARAVALDDAADGSQCVTLADGSRLTDLHAVVLAQGHLPVRPAPHEAELAAFAARHGLVYVPPANPADVSASAVPPGATVVLRGLGLNFFDHMALFTQGRGGRYERRAGRLVYLPSGREPQLYAGSRRGLPYHARGENEKGVQGRHEPLFLTPETIAKLRAQTAGGPGLDFRETLWPLVAREVEAVYYGALLTARGGAEQGDSEQGQAEQDGAERGGPAQATAFLERFVAHAFDNGSDDELLTAFGIGPDERWDWAAIEKPYGERRFTGPADFTGWLLGQLRADLAAAHAGNVSGPVKAALDVLRDLRNELRLAVDHGGLDGDSYRADLDRWYTPLNAYLSIGPPARRIEELVALIEAGTVRIAGPGLRVTADEESGAYLAESPAVPGSRVRAHALIEARLPEIDLRRTADPLLDHLLTTGQCAPYRIPTATGGKYETGGLAVTGRPYRLVDAQGVPHPRRFAFGVPTEAVHWVTAAGIRPGVGSVILSDSDAIARAVLDAPAGPVDVRPAAQAQPR
ncbi:FAD/NAD(P)-binding protein [Streptomyces sp. 796.1]|uniref:FAD/NAD(P)-binding protein n=1 Tax=Streptomyces sp. 796.1 TaxID=3163029 RepID=UPI0039C93246